MSSSSQLDRLMPNGQIKLIPTELLRHIEGYSKKRVAWLVEKIKTEACWTKPLCISEDHYLVMDGQHRMEAAKILGLPYVPCVVFNYHAVEIWSLRDNYHVDHETVINRAIHDNIYPYKTVKHRFPSDIPALSIALAELTALTPAKNPQGELSCV